MSAAQMSGPDHFRRAETLLEALRDPHSLVADHRRDELATRAQVHATLALVAVTAEQGSHTGAPAARREALLDVDGEGIVVDGPWKALLRPTEETS